MSSNNKSAAINKIKAQQQAANKAGAATAPSAAAPASVVAAAPTSNNSSNNRYNARAGAGRARWAVDLTEQRAAPTTFLTSGTSSQEVVPFGFSAGGMEYSKEDEKNPRDEAKQADLIYKSAMAMAQAPGKQLLMTCFMLWMSGNSLQIFSIMMLSMALWTPLSEILAVQSRFLRFADSGVDMTLPKITFVLIHCAGLAMGLYKCNTMGLLPTSTADWIDTSLRTAVQVSGGGMI